MKEKRRYHTLRLLLALLSAAALWSCTQDGMPSTVAAEDDTRFPLTLQVTDAGFAPDGDLSTRTTDTDYRTTFTVGDSIGVYVSRERHILPYANLLFVLTAEGWKNPDGQSLWYEGENSRYYAYYPYQPEYDKQHVLYANIYEEADVYFQPIIRNWPIPADQSTHEKFTAADLMVCRGKLDDKTRRELTFTFVHRMVLLEMNLTEVMNAYPEAKVTFHSFRPWQPDPEVAVYRYLLQAENTSELLKDPGLSVTSSGKTYDFPFTGIRDIDNRGKCIKYNLRNQ